LGNRKKSLPPEIVLDFLAPPEILKIKRIPKWRK